MSSVLINAILNLASDKSLNKPKRIDYKLVFVLPKIFEIIGWLSLIPGLAILLYGLITFNKDDIGAQLGLFGLLGGLGMIIILLCRVMKVEVSKVGITKTTMFGKKQQVDWKNIQDIKYLLASQELLIRSSDQKIKCNRYLIGFYDLIDILEKKTKISKDRMSLPKGILNETQHLGRN